MLMIQRQEPKTKQSKTVHLILQILHKKTHTTCTYVQET